MGYKKSREHIANFTSATFNSKNVGVSHQGRATSDSNDMGAPDLPGRPVPGINVQGERAPEILDTTGTAASVVSGTATAPRGKSKRAGYKVADKVVKKEEKPKPVRR